MTPTIIHRKRKHEMEQAVKDLESRGFKLIYGPVEHKKDGKSFSRDEIGRRVFQYNTLSSVWIAKLIREVN